MEINNPELTKIIAEEDTDKLGTFLDNLNIESIDNTLLKDLCLVMQFENKGFRNLITQFFLSNRFEILPDCIINFIESKDITLINLSGEILIQYDKLSTEALIQFINKSDNDFDIKFAADILAMIIDEKALNALFELLERTKNDNVLISCIEGFGNNKSEKAIDILKNLYHQKDIFKPYIVEAMGKIGTKEAFQFIKECYNDMDLLVKYNVLESLGHIGNEESFFFLIGELQNADESFVQPILESIHQLQLRYGFDLPYDEKIKRALLILLNQKEVEYIKIAIKFLSPYNDPELIYEMLRHFGIDEEVDMIIYNKVLQNISEVIEIMPNIILSNPANLALLLSLINQLLENNSDAFVNVDKFLMHKLIDAVSRCLVHTEEMVRLYSVELLFKLDIETALVMLDDEFLNANFWIKLRLIEILETINHKAAIDFLIKMTEDENEMISQRAYEVLNIKNFSFN